MPELEIVTYRNSVAQSNRKKWTFFWPWCASILVDWPDSSRKTDPSLTLQVFHVHDGENAHLRECWSRRVERFPLRPYYSNFSFNVRQGAAVFWTKDDSLSLLERDSDVVRVLDDTIYQAISLEGWGGFSWARTDGASTLALCDVHMNPIVSCALPLPYSHEIRWKPDEAKVGKQRSATFFAFDSPYRVSWVRFESGAFGPWRSIRVDRLKKPEGNLLDGFLLADRLEWMRWNPETQTFQVANVKLRKYYDNLCLNSSFAWRGTRIRDHAGKRLARSECSNLFADHRESGTLWCVDRDKIARYRIVERQPLNSPTLAQLATRRYAEATFHGLDPIMKSTFAATIEQLTHQENFSSHHVFLPIEGVLPQ